MGTVHSRLRIIHVRQPSRLSLTGKFNWRVTWMFVVAMGLLSSACSPGSSPGQSSFEPSGPVIVTLRVADAESYKILMTEPDDIAIAEDLLAGTEAPRIPNGRVVRDGDGGVNAGYGWHIDPADLEWADSTTEVCDGLPSDVEKGVITSDRYCPWSSEVVGIDPG